MSYLQIVSSIALTPSISQCADQEFYCIDNKHSTDHEFCHIDIKDALAFGHCSYAKLFLVLSTNKILPSFALGLY